MSTGSLGRRPALFIGAGMVVLAFAVVSGVIAAVPTQRPTGPPTACHRGSRARPGPGARSGTRAGARARTGPDRPPDPIEAEVEVTEVVDLSRTGAGVFQAGSSEDEPIPVDDEAVDDFAQRVAGWLDDHLDDLQAGGAGSIDGWPGDLEVVTADLASPDRVVETARYELRVGAMGDPEWVEADVYLTLEDGDEITATFTFVIENRDDEVAATLAAAEGGA